MKQDNEISKIKINLLFSILLQVVTTICGLIVPRVILDNFGSETNGLVNSITQFINYITLLEGGVTGVISASLYKPLRNNDEQKVSAIINATKYFFRKIGIIYIIYILIIAFVYPGFVETSYSYFYVVLLTMVLGLNLIFEYFLSLHLQILIKANRKVYITSIATIIVKIANLIMVLLTVTVYKDILALKFLTALIFLVYPIIYNIYVKKNFNLDKTVLPDEQAISQRWDGFGQNIAYFIHSNTDIIILTFFASLTSVSVYSVYYMVASSIKGMVIAIASAVSPSIGNKMAGEDLNEKNSAFDLYSFSVYFISTVFYSCAIVLIVPFVKIYTVNVTDASYIEPVFGTILMLAQLMYCYRDPYLTVAYVTNHFKDTAIYAYAEAGLNIIISIALVFKLGLVGVAFGTFVSFLVRLVCHAHFLKKNVLFRKVKKFYKSIFVFGIGCFLICVICKLLGIGNDTSYLLWAVSGIETFAVAILVLVVLSTLFYRKELKSLLTKFLRIRI